MSEGRFVKFKWLDCKPVKAEVQGRTVLGTFQLEDGTFIEISIDINRCGVALEYKNPDGSPHHHVEPNLRVRIIPSDKVYAVPRETIAFPSQPKPDQRTGVT
ncbi:MAG: hypothetical protein ACE5PO_07870 [Candidatus Bathyarchaeia archaeon]